MTKDTECPHCVEEQAVFNRMNAACAAGESVALSAREVGIVLAVLSDYSDLIDDLMETDVAMAEAQGATLQ